MNRDRQTPTRSTRHLQTLLQQPYAVLCPLPAKTPVATNNHASRLHGSRVTCFRCPLCFHILTNPFSGNSFLFRSIQIPGGCTPSSQRRTSNPPSRTSHFFLCHTSEKCARNSFPCHTCKIAALQVLSLPHIRKTGGWGPIIVNYESGSHLDDKDEAEDDMRPKEPAWSANTR